MKINFKNLEIWKLSHEFVLKVYSLVKKFPEYESNNLTSQLRRAATCLPLNIAEGSGAGSAKIFLNYLVFAYRSIREVEAALLLARDLKYLNDEEYNLIYKDLDKLTAKLVSYMKYLEQNYIDERERKRDITLFYCQQREKIKDDLGKFAYVHS